MFTRREFITIAACAATETFADAEGNRHGERMKAILADIRTRHDVPALAAAWLDSGRATAAAVGVRKYGNTTPVSVGDRFHLGSCTKAMTAVLVGVLVEEGELDWTTPLAEALPSVAPAMHPEMRAVTVDHLLAHRAGLAADLHPTPASLRDLVEARRSPQVSRRQRMAFVEQILKAKPSSEPGSTFIYSNAGYIVLGAIVETLWNAPWETIMRRRIFGPLKMRSAGFGAMGSPGKIDQPWQHRLRDGEHVPVEPGAFADNPPALGPAGTVHCSVTDWAQFLTACLEGEGRKGLLLKPETWRRLHTPRFGGDYAGGWLVTQRDWGGRVLTHTGSNTLSFCVAWLAPDRRFGVAVMTNQGGDEAARACDETAGTIIGAFAPKA
jgi:CubicO group peptidase (beta-lactamase class C family)